MIAQVGSKIIKKFNRGKRRLKIIPIGKNMVNSTVVNLNIAPRSYKLI